MIINNPNIKFKNEYLFLFLVFVISRFFYLFFFDINFDAWILKKYWQFFPEDLLKNDLLKSLIYNHYQAPLLNLILGLLIKITNKFHFILQSIFLVFSLVNFIFLFKILEELKIKKNLNLLIVIILMILPTTILYENHPYKEHIVMCFLTVVIYYSIRIIKKPSNCNYLFFTLFLILLLLTRETFHIFWAFIYLIFLNKINKQFKKNLTSIILIIIFVSPFYFKNLYLYKKFSISLTPFEHLSQKLEFFKEMKKNGQHEVIRNFIFKNNNDFDKFFSSISKIFFVPLNSDPDIYVKIIEYNYKYDNQLLKSNTAFNEVYLAVDELRKEDFLKVFKNYPELLLISSSNAALRHFFRSSDTFYFTRFNADKIPGLIRLSHCIKITLACIYEFPFEKQKFQINNQFFMKIDDRNFGYIDKIKFSLNDMNFLIIFIYCYVAISMIKGLLNNKNKGDKLKLLINFWVITFFAIFLLLILFEDGEIPRHRYPFDYLMLVFSIYYYKLNSNLFKLDDHKKN